MKIATTQFDMRKISTADDFFVRCQKLIHAACLENCQAILFPEYFSLSQLLYENLQSNSDQEFKLKIRDNQNHRKNIEAFFSKQAEDHKIVIIAGSVPYSENEQLVNRSVAYFPDGRKVIQDKIHMTRFESENWQVNSGPNRVQTFSIGPFVCAICICYDIEFPLLTQKLAHQGVHVIFVPSNTDDLHGYWRVRLCTQARTIENQCYTVMSSCVGGNPDHAETAEHHGQAGIYSPSDVGFPTGGIVQLGDFDQEGICIGELNFELLEKIRKSGTVLNLRDSNSP